MDVETKLPKVGTTIFTVMSQLAVEHGAVNLGQGFPDFPVPAFLVEALLGLEVRGDVFGQQRMAPARVDQQPLLRDELHAVAQCLASALIKGRLQGH